jgi:voltage-dependent potassium channel beta subunit
MDYRRLGSAGIKVSVLSFGSWITFGPQVDVSLAERCLSVAYENGINFFDNAETYASGESERIMGEALKRLKWRRGSYLISTKHYWGLNDGSNERNTLNRKYLLEGIDGSLKRLQLEYVDLLFCHRPDPNTPLEETVRAMSEIVSSGRAMYWGTSEWSGAEIALAWGIAKQNGWHPPQMEQPQYNLMHRQRVESEYSRLYSDIGLGLTTWSPLASGLLTGKYLNDVPKNSRANVTTLGHLKESLTSAENQKVVKRLLPIANDLGCSLAQLAIAWCVKNERVSTVITGASSTEQLQENLKAVEVVAKLSTSVMSSIEECLREKIS